MDFVWSESIRQAQDLARAWTTDGIYSCSKDTRTVSLNVLAATGFRKSFAFKRSNGEDTQGEYDDFSYCGALQTILDNAVLLLVLRPDFLLSRYLPKSWKRIGTAAKAFQQYMSRMLEEEIELLRQGKKGSESLMTALIRAGDSYIKPSEDTDVRTKGLSVDEIFGNIFVINFAGHDTTANTLAFSILLLAAYPGVQSWLAEEVARETYGVEPENWKYNELFPRLVRTQAVMVRVPEKCRGKRLG
jgi:hypothetical protein